MNLQEYIGQVIPLLLFYAFFAFPDQMLSASITPLGRFIPILLITLYTCIHPAYGFTMCVFVILYYQMDCVEGFAADVSGELLTSASFSHKVDEFRQNHCINNTLTYKSRPVKSENASHIFPEMSFTDDICNPCDKNCGISISSRLDDQEELMYPKMGTEWVSQIWEKWFSEDNKVPYAHTSADSRYEKY